MAKRIVLSIKKALDVGGESRSQLFFTKKTPIYKHNIHNINDAVQTATRIYADLMNSPKHKTANKVA